MAAGASFWPDDLGAEEPDLPVVILRRQAGYLSEQTEGLLNARVESQGWGLGFSHSFNIVVPALDNYTYELFVVRHEIEGYPANCYAENNRTEVADSDGLNEWLRATLASQRTRQILRNLTAQAKG
jgi:hypothetical protein